MIAKTINILLADDDKDDCFMFEEVLSELSIPTKLTTVSNGEQLCQLLDENEGYIPDILFLDLNMPRKNGFECLEEIRNTDKFKSLPIIIFSTSIDEVIADRLYKSGAHFYICKPPEYLLLKDVIHQALQLTSNKNNLPLEQTSRDKFVIKTLLQVP